MVPDETLLHAGAGAEGHRDQVCGQGLHGAAGAAGPDVRDGFRARPAVPGALLLPTALLLDSLRVSQSMSPII